ncbi:MAG: hypothetical protein ACRERV_14750, partial [Methylococcales bacterium]
GANARRFPTLACLTSRSSRRLGQQLVFPSALRGRGLALSLGLTVWPWIPFFKTFMHLENIIGNLIAAVLWAGIVWTIRSIRKATRYLDPKDTEPNELDFEARKTARLMGYIYDPGDKTHVLLSNIIYLNQYSHFVHEHKMNVIISLVWLELFYVASANSPYPWFAFINISLGCVVVIYSYWNFYTFSNKATAFASGLMDGISNTLRRYQDELRSND